MQEKIKILVADDEEEMRESLYDILEKEGYYVELADDGNVALEKFKENGFALVVADIKMPRMGGISLLKEVKKIKPETPVIIITGYATVENAIESLKIGVFSFITKPFNVEEVLKVIKKGVENVIKKHNNPHNNPKESNSLIKHSVQIEIPSNRKSIWDITSQIIDAANYYGFFDEGRDDLTLRFTIEEALENAIIHGNKKDINKKIKVNCEIDDEKLKISIQDEGDGFSLEDILKENKNRDYLSKVGIGIFCMVYCMDNVFYNEKRNGITLVKYK